MMTLEDIKNLSQDCLTCKDVSSVLRVNQTRLHTTAMIAPEKLGFPVVCVGSRVKIPRLAFIKWMEGENDA